MSGDVSVHGTDRTVDGRKLTPPIRAVGFNPREDATAEVTTVRALRETCDPSEFDDRVQRPSFDMILHVTGGATGHEVDFRTFALSPGDVLWVHSGQTQRWGDVWSMDAVVVIFASTTLAPATVNVLRTLGVTQNEYWPDAAAEGTHLSREFAALLEYSDSRKRSGALGGDVYRIALQHRVSALLAELAAHVADAPEAASSERRLVHLAFVDAVEENFTRHRSVGRYADLLSYSPRTIDRATRSITGLSAKQLIDKRVLLEAKRLLVHNDEPVAAVASRLGFDDAANFSKFFVRNEGSSPGTFRRNSLSSKPSGP